jgi:hypothetical protein
MRWSSSALGRFAACLVIMFSVTISLNKARVNGGARSFHQAAARAAWRLDRRHRRWVEWRPPKRWSGLDSVFSEIGEQPAADAGGSPPRGIGGTGIRAGPEWVEDSAPPREQDPRPSLNRVRGPPPDVPPFMATMIGLRHIRAPSARLGETSPGTRIPAKPRALKRRPELHSNNKLTTLARECRAGFQADHKIRTMKHAAQPAIERRAARHGPAARPYRDQ